jgi:hypothetical protein
MLEAVNDAERIGHAIKAARPPIHKAQSRYFGDVCIAEASMMQGSGGRV